MFDTRPQWICQARVSFQGFLFATFGGVFSGVILFLGKGPRLMSDIKEEPVIFRRLNATALGHGTVSHKGTEKADGGGEMMSERPR